MEQSFFQRSLTKHNFECSNQSLQFTLCLLMNRSTLESQSLLSFRSILSPHVVIKATEVRFETGSLHNLSVQYSKVIVRCFLCASILAIIFISIIVIFILFFLSFFCLCICVCNRSLATNSLLPCCASILPDEASLPS